MLLLTAATRTLSAISRKVSSSPGKDSLDSSVDDDSLIEALMIENQLAPLLASGCGLNSTVASHTDKTLLKTESSYLKPEDSFPNNSVAVLNHSTDTLPCTPVPVLNHPKDDSFPNDPVLYHPTDSFSNHSLSVVKDMEKYSDKCSQDTNEECSPTHSLEETIQIVTETVKRLDNKWVWLHVINCL